MLDNFLNNRFFILYFIPLIAGALTVFSYEPFNYTLINFLILPLFFYLIVYIKKKSKSKYRKKPYKINLFIFGTSFGFGFYLSGIYWITNSLTFELAKECNVDFNGITFRDYARTHFDNFIKANSRLNDLEIKNYIKKIKNLIM